MRAGGGRSLIRTAAGLATAVAASVILHMLPAWFPLGLSPPEQADVQTLWLVSLSSGPGEEDPGRPGKAADGQGNKAAAPAGKGAEQVSENRSSGAAQLIPVHSSLRREELDLVLSQIRKRRQPAGRRANPPGPGRVELGLKLTKDGDVASAWVVHEQGSPGLAEFALELVHRAGPFPEAGAHMRDRLVLGCSFVVHRKTQTRGE